MVTLCTYCCSPKLEDKYVKCLECNIALKKSQQGDKCPASFCSGKIVIRKGKYGEFKACSDWNRHELRHKASKDVKFEALKPNLPTKPSIPEYRRSMPRSGNNARGYWLPFKN